MAEHWLPITEPPKSNVPVLACDNKSADDNAYIAHMNGIGNWYLGDWDETRSCSPTHWCDLKTPPRSAKYRLWLKRQLLIRDLLEQIVRDVTAGQTGGVFNARIKGKALEILGEANAPLRQKD